MFPLFLRLLFFFCLLFTSGVLLSFVHSLFFCVCNGTLGSFLLLSLAVVRCELDFTRGLGGCIKEARMAFGSKLHEPSSHASHSRHPSHAKSKAHTSSGGGGGGGGGGGVVGGAAAAESHGVVSPLADPIYANTHLTEQAGHHHHHGHHHGHGQHDSNASRHGASDKGEGGVVVGAGIELKKQSEQSAI